MRHNAYFYFFDQFGRQRKVVDRNQNRTYYLYDVDESSHPQDGYNLDHDPDIASGNGLYGELLKITQQGGLAYRYSYSDKHLATVTDFAGRTTIFESDGGLVTKVTEKNDPGHPDWADAVVRFSYNGEDSLLDSVTDAAGNRTTITYGGYQDDPRTQGVTETWDSKYTVHKVTNGDNAMWRLVPYLVDGIGKFIGQQAHSYKPEETEDEGADDPTQAGGNAAPL